jgi:hypothetical protein
MKEDLAVMHYIELYWYFILLYILGGAIYSVIKWVIQLYRLRRRVLEIDPFVQGATGWRDEAGYIASRRLSAMSYAGFNDSEYPPKASKNKSTLFWWAVLWPINLIWTLVADVAKEAWRKLYDWFGGIYNRLAKAILPE